MKRIVLSLTLVCALLVCAAVSAQQDDDPILVAYRHYVDGVTDAASDFSRCTSFASSYRTWQVSGRSADVVDLLGHVSNDVRDVNADTELMVCELAYNSSMIRLQIEVQLILAGIDRDILKAISQR